MSVICNTEYVVARQQSNETLIALWEAIREERNTKLLVTRAT